MLLVPATVFRLVEFDKYLPLSSPALCGILLF